MFAGLNRAKESITLDARTPEGRQLALDLARSCDVVIDNFSAGVMARMKLAYDDLRAVKPDIIVVSINGWGRGGPLSGWSAYGPTLQAYTGMYWTWRHPGAATYQGIKSPPADYLCAAQALLGILAAISHRERTGEGQFVELVMLEGLAHSLGPYYLAASLEAESDVGRGSGNAPAGCYPCDGKDSWCVIACETDAQWEALKRVLGEPGWAFEPRFGTRQQRVACAAELDRLLAEWTSARAGSEVMHTLQAHGVPAGIVQTAEDVFNDPHLRARGHLVSTPNPSGGEPVVVEGMTAHFGLSKCDDHAAAPQLGEHNQAIFGGLLNLSPEQIQHFEQAKAIF
jgi:benzylsuccinate CoA-transferase BbsF subunit